MSLRENRIESNQWRFFFFLLRFYLAPMDFVIGKVSKGYQWRKKRGGEEEAVVVAVTAGALGLLVGTKQTFFSSFTMS